MTLTPALLTTLAVWAIVGFLACYQPRGNDEE